MGDLQSVFNSYHLDKGKPMYKAPSYAQIYEGLLERFRNRPVVLVEIGVGKGGCLQVWKEYFGSQAEIYGVDHYDQLLYEEPQIHGILCDQSKSEELAALPGKLPPLDIVIDDGSHVNTDQIATLETLFPQLNPGGVYVVEDTHTSYREKDYGGGYLHPGSFLEYAKRLVDSLHFHESPDIPFPTYINQLQSVAFCSGLAVLTHA